jgi:hypothetical protein
VQQLEQVASLGIGTARGLASVFDTAIGRHLIADSVLDRILQPNDVGIDAVLQVPILKGHGFFYVPHPNNASVGDYSIISNYSCLCRHFYSVIRVMADSWSKSTGTIIYRGHLFVMD